MEPAERSRLAGSRRPRPVRGSRWGKFAKQVVDYYGGLCHLCDHGGARQADHLIPVTERPDLSWVMSNCRPAHGAPGNPCPRCGVYCNQVRGGLSVSRARRIIAERIAGQAPPDAKTPLNAETPGTRNPDAGRFWLAGQCGAAGPARLSQAPAPANTRVKNPRTSSPRTIHGLRAGSPDRVT